MSIGQSKNIIVNSLRAFFALGTRHDWTMLECLKKQSSREKQFNFVKTSIFFKHVFIITYIII